MSLIHEFKSTEEAIKELQARLAEMSPSVSKTLELAAYVKEQCAADGIPLMDLFFACDENLAKRLAKAGGASAATTGSKPPRKARTVKVYKNPHNGEVVETKGGNHKTLKEWKLNWGGDVVEGWVQK